MDTKNYPATIESSAGKSGTLQVTIRNLPPEERRKLALKNLGLFWGLMIATIPLPPIHWVTVPFFFFFGIYRFFKKIRESRHILPTHFACPECQKEMECPEQTPVSPLALTCPHCRYNLKLRWIE